MEMSGVLYSRPIYPWERPRYLLRGRLVGLQSRSERFEKSQSPAHTGIETQTAAFETIKRLNAKHT